MNLWRRTIDFLRQPIPQEIDIWALWVVAAALIAWQIAAWGAEAFRSPYAGENPVDPAHPKFRVTPIQQAGDTSSTAIQMR